LARYQCSVLKPACLMVWGCITANRTGNLHMWQGTTSDERYIQVLEQPVLPSRFFKEGLLYFSKTILNCILQHGFLLACSPDLSPTENVQCIMRLKVRQRRHRMVEQLVLYQKRMELHSFPKGPATGPLSLQTVTD